MGHVTGTQETIWGLFGQYVTIRAWKEINECKWLKHIKCENSRVPMTASSIKELERENLKFK